MGSVDNYTWNVVDALLEREKEFVSWPNPLERKAISSRIYDYSGFSDCLGYVDGTIIGFDKRPTLYAEDYLTRKGGYGINTQLVCDDRQSIRYVSTGWPGCTHDCKMYNNSSLYTSPERYFSPSEYILADSAYGASDSVVPAFKAANANDLTPRRKQFNLLHAKARESIENCIGMLKGKFQSLMAMRLRIMSDADAVLVSRYIRAICVLHNCLIDDNFDWRTEYEKLNEDQQEDDQPDYLSATHNDNRREVLLDLLVPQ